MCGIVGYLGEQDACAILLNGLRELEYRGYDSAGVAVLDRAGLRCVKAVGKLGDAQSSGAYAILLISETAPGRIFFARQEEREPAAICSSAWRGCRRGSRSPASSATASRSSTRAGCSW